MQKLLEKSIKLVELYLSFKGRQLKGVYILGNFLVSVVTN